MKLRLILCLFVVFASFSLHAQFVGDSLAAAGFNISEEEAMAGLSAIAAAREARTAPAPPPPEPPPEPPPQAAAATPEPAPLAPLGPLGPGGAGFSGGGKVTTVKDVEAYRAAFRPVGTKVNAPPAGAEAIKTASGAYAFSLGVFYQQRPDGWVVVPAPVGAVVTGRPAGASMIIHYGKSYLYYNGAFFAWNGSTNSSTVLAPPAGVVGSYIPETATKKERSGQVCFQYGAACFKPKYRGTALVYEVS